jgi:hypothetical protein
MMVQYTGLSLFNSNSLAEVQFQLLTHKTNVILDLLKEGGTASHMIDAEGEYIDTTLWVGILLKHHMIVSLLNRVTKDLVWKLSNRCCGSNLLRGSAIITDLNFRQGW